MFSFEEYQVLFGKCFSVRCQKTFPQTSQWTQVQTGPKVQDRLGVSWPSRGGFEASESHVHLAREKMARERSFYRKSHTHFPAGSFANLGTNGAGNDFPGGLRLGGSQAALWSVGRGGHETKSPGPRPVFVVLLRTRHQA